MLALGIGANTPRPPGRDKPVFGEIVGIDPANGMLLWQHPHETDYGLNTMTPVWGKDNLLFVSSGYNGRSRTLKLTQRAT
jgi:hypothetical protein